MPESIFKEDITQHLHGSPGKLCLQPAFPRGVGSQELGHMQAGAGGVDAMDWAEMLERMYLRWVDQQGFQATIIERSRGMSNPDP